MNLTQKLRTAIRGRIVLDLPEIKEVLKVRDEIWDLLWEVNYNALNEVEKKLYNKFESKIIPENPIWKLNLSGEYIPELENKRLKYSSWSMESGYNPYEVFKYCELRNKRFGEQKVVKPIPYVFSGIEEIKKERPETYNILVNKIEQVIDLLNVANNKMEYLEEILTDPIISMRDINKHFNELYKIIKEEEGK